MTNKEALFNKLEAENRDRLYRVCRVYAYDPAHWDDLYQEILLQIWRSIPKFREEASWNTYLYRIAINTALSYNRKLKKHRTFSLDQVPERPTDTTSREEKESQEALLELLYQEIKTLKETDKTLILFLLEDLSYKEIADITGHTVNHVGVSLNRAKKRLRARLNFIFGLQKPTSGT